MITKRYSLEDTEQRELKPLPIVRVYEYEETKTGSVMPICLSRPQGHISRRERENSPKEGSQGEMETN